MARDAVFRRFLSTNRACVCAKRRIFVRFGTKMQVSERVVTRFARESAKERRRTALSMRKSDTAPFFGPENSFYRQNWSIFTHFMAAFRKSVCLIRACFFCLQRQKNKSD